MLADDVDALLLRQHRRLDVVRDNSKQLVFGVVEACQFFVTFLSLDGVPHQHHDKDEEQDHGEQRQGEQTAALARFLLLQLQFMFFLRHLVFHLIFANQGLLVFVVDGVPHLYAFLKIAYGTFRM